MRTGLLITLLALALPALAHAQTRWTGAGDGTTWTDGANWSTNEPPAANADVVIDAAGTYTVVLDVNPPQLSSLTLNAAGATLDITDEFAFLSIGTLAQNAGNVQTAATLNVDGEWTWAGGNLGGTGGLQVFGASTISGAGSRTLTGLFIELRGNTTMRTTNAAVGLVIRVDGTSLISYFDQTFAITTPNTAVLTATGGAALRFENLGILAGSAGAGTPPRIDAAVQSSGEIRASSGDLTLTLADGSDLNGPISIASGATLRLGGPFGSAVTIPISGDVTGAGTLQLAGNSYSITSSTFDVTGAVDITGATSFSSSTTIGSLGALSVSAATSVLSAASASSLTVNNTLALIDPLTVSGDASLAFGSVRAFESSPSAELTIGGSTSWGSTNLTGVAMSLNGPATIDGFGRTVDGGSVTFANNSTYARGATTLVGGAVAFNQGTMLFSSSGTSEFTTFQGGAAPSVLSNDGTLRFDVPNAVTTFGVDVRSFGTIQVSGGGLFFSGSDLINTDDGQITGEGRIAFAGGSLDNEGAVRPGFEQGDTRTLDFDPAFEVGSTLSVEIGGAGDGEFDRITVAGNAQLGGNLSISFVNGYDPPAGTTFDLITTGTGSTTGSVTGTFANTFLPTLSGDRTLRVDVLSDRVRLVVEGPASSVPARLTWTGDGADDLWSTGANWDLGRAPAAGDTAVVALAGADVQVSADVSVARVELDGSTTPNLVQDNTSIGLGSNTTLTTSGDFVQRGGVFFGPGTLDIGGTFVWEAGNQQSIGATNANGGALFATGSNKSVSFRTITLRGASVHQAGIIQAANSVVRLEAGATLDVQSGGTFFSNGSGDAPTFENDGTVVKTAGDPFLPSLARAQFSGSGTFRSQSGSLNLTDLGGGGGAFDLEADGADTGILFQGSSPNGSAPITLSGTLSGSGTVGLRTGLVATLTGTLAVTGATEFITREVTVTSDADVQSVGSLTVLASQTTFETTDALALEALTLIPGGLGASLTLGGALSVAGDAEIQNNTTLISPAAITVAGGTRWSGGTISSSSGVQPLALNGGVTLEGSSKTLAGRAATLDGTSTWTSGDLALQNATLTIPAGASLDVSLEGALTSAGASSVTVAGTLTKSGTGITTVGADVAVPGTLAAQSGTLTPTAALTGTGRLIGSGTLDLTDATAYDVQTLAPGATGDGSTETLTVIGPLTLPSTGTLSLDVTGTSAGQFDRLTVGGALVLDGTLRVTLGGGFAPSDGERIVLATGSPVQGAFASTLLPPGFTLDVAQNLVTLVAPTTNVDPSLIVWTGGGADSLWSRTANWDLNRTPIPGDTVRFDLDSGVNYRPTADADYAIGRLEVTTSRASVRINGTLTVGGDVLFSRGIISGAGTLAVGGTVAMSDGILGTRTIQVDGPMTWTGGSMGGVEDGSVTTLASGGTFTPPPGSFRRQAQLIVRSRTLRLGGVTDVTDGYIGLESGAELIVQAGATLRFSGDDASGVRPDSPTAPRPTVVNDGLIVKTGGAGTFGETWIGGSLAGRFGDPRNDYVDVSGLRHVSLRNWHAAPQRDAREHAWRNVRGDGRSAAGVLATGIAGGSTADLGHHARGRSHQPFGQLHPRGHARRDRRHVDQRDSDVLGRDDADESGIARRLFRHLARRDRRQLRPEFADAAANRRLRQHRF